MAETGTQKALAVNYKGGPFELVRHAIWTPGPGEILVKIQGVGLNQSDWKFQTGVFDASGFIKDYPVFTGTDGAGTVVGVGEGVTRFSKGDRVLFQGWLTAERTTFQEYAVVEAALTAKIPQTVTALETASIPACVSTAAMIFWGSNLEGTGLKPFWEEDAEGYYSGKNKSILIIGASSITGLFGLQLAKYLGLGPIIVTSSLKHTEYLKSMGAAHVIDRSADITPVVEKLKRELNIGIDFIFDAVHVPITQTEVDLLSPNGVLMTIWVIDPTLVFDDGRRGVPMTVALGRDKELKKQMYARIESLLEKGKLMAARVEKIDGGLGGIAEGLGKMERSEVSGVKLVVDPTETADF
ncbi:chaperonin 10-like protein [Mycena alexandri]|uniref:Chaperonin 10-like protein n=1 Tax=Mycena alexandri TaxID=1745969 RepID=A0AAD6SXN5_9AGAR|nr:chaperonin 10-like protein [Mycena alexandri]